MPTPSHVRKGSVEEHPTSNSRMTGLPPKFRADSSDGQHATDTAQPMTDVGRDHPDGISRSDSVPQKLGQNNDRNLDTRAAPNGSTATGAAQENAAHRQSKGYRSDEDLPPPSDDETDTGDYVSRLHVFAAQKNSIVTSLRSQFEDVSGSRVKRWKCIFFGKLLPYSKGDDLLSREGVSGLKKKAKQKAAKSLLDLLLEIVEKRKEESEAEKQKDQEMTSDGNADGKSSKTGVSPQESSEDLDESATGNEALRLAYSTLESMWSQGHLTEMPHYSFDRFEERWKGTVIVKTQAHGEISVSSIATQKKIARQKVSLLALQKLNKMNVEGSEVLFSICPDTEAPGGSLFTAKNDPRPNPDVGCVRESGDDATSPSDGEADIGTNGILRLPPDFAIEVAVSETACDDWFGNHVQIDSQIGLYVDSHYGRGVIRRRDWKDVDSRSEKEPLKWPLICVCTEKQGLLISAKCKIDKASDDSEECHYWMPGALADVLECDTVLKYGHSIVDGLRNLRNEMEIDCVRVDDVAVTSLAITGVAKVDGAHFNTTLPELCEYWLRKQLTDQGHQLPLGDYPIGNKFSGHDLNAVTTAVLSAYACLLLPGAWASELKRKEMMLHGSGEAFRDLRQKLMSRPWKQYERHRTETNR